MKKILSLILCLAVVLGCVSVALASGDTSIVKYESKSTYTVQVPEYIVPNDVGQQDTTEYSVTATNVVLPAGETLSVFVEYSGLVKEENNVSIPYKLYSGSGEITSGAQILSIAAGNPDETSSAQFGAAVTEDAKYSGVYLDTAIFSIKAPKTYTLEEIEANDHMIAVGETKPEYVVAEYNDDYTTVTLFKNGADSDGKMKAFEELSSNLLTGHEDTLTTVNVNDGVVNIGAWAFTNVNGAMSAINVEVPYTGPGGDVMVWIYEEEQGSFPGVLTTLNVFGDSLQSIDSYAFAFCSKLSTLNLNDSLQTVGDTAFAYADLSNFSKIPDGVQTIGASAFAYTNMPAIQLGENVETIESQAFAYNIYATGDLVFPESLRTVDQGAFLGCCSLDEELVLNDGLEGFDDRTFSGCVNLSNETLVIPSSVKSVGSGIISGAGAFYHCFSANNNIEITISPENTMFEIKNGEIYEKSTGRNMNAFDKTGTVVFDNGIGRAGDTSWDVVYVDPTLSGTLDLSQYSFEGYGAAYTPMNTMFLLSILKSDITTIIMPDVTKTSDTAAKEIATFLSLFDRLPNTTVVLNGGLVKEGDVYKLA